MPKSNKGVLYLNGKGYLMPKGNKEVLYLNGKSY